MIKQKKTSELIKSNYTLLPFFIKCHHFSQTQFCAQLSKPWEFGGRRAFFEAPCCCCISATASVAADSMLMELHICQARRKRNCPWGPGGEKCDCFCFGATPFGWKVKQSVYLCFVTLYCAVKRDKNRRTQTHKKILGEKVSSPKKSFFFMGSYSLKD